MDGSRKKKLLKLRKQKYTWDEISKDIGRSVDSCKTQFGTLRSVSSIPLKRMTEDESNKLVHYKDVDNLSYSQIRKIMGKQRSLNGYRMQYEAIKNERSGHLPLKRRLSEQEIVGEPESSYKEYRYAKRKHMEKEAEESQDKSESSKKRNSDVIKDSLFFDNSLNYLENFYDPELDLDSFFPDEKPKDGKSIKRKRKSIKRKRKSIKRKRKPSTENENQSNENNLHN